MYIRNNINTLINFAVSENYKIYFIPKDNISQYWYVLNQGVADMSNLLGIPYIWDPPTERSYQMQINIINNAVNNGADALIIAALDAVRISSTIENAKANGVKIIYVDTPANEEGVITLATDDFSAGATAGENMVIELAGVGLRQGTIGIIDISPTSRNTNLRDYGFRSVLNNNANYKLLDTQYGGDVANSELITDTLIANYPDLVGIFATNEDSTLGIGYALQKSNKQVVGIGFDYPPETQKMIEDGILKATMVQNQYTMGYLGMAETVAALKGLPTGPPFLNTGVSVRTKYTKN